MPPRGDAGDARRRYYFSIHFYDLSGGQVDAAAGITRQCEPQAEAFGCILEALDDLPPDSTILY
jgi:hypothetical protein